MPETPSSYNPKRRTSDIERIAKFMNGFLAVEMLYDIPCPKKFENKDYDDMGDDEQNEWYEYTFEAVFRDAAFQVVGLLARELKLVELNLIKRRIDDHFKKAGIKYHRE
jgi:hypothetical protein